MAGEIDFKVVCIAKYRPGDPVLSILVTAVVDVGVKEHVPFAAFDRNGVVGILACVAISGCIKGRYVVTAILVEVESRLPPEMITTSGLGESLKELAFAQL